MNKTHMETMETKDKQPVFPWYKERLQTKYLNSPTNKISLVSSCCRFVNMNLDDLRDCSPVLSEAQRGISPVIFHPTPKQSSTQKPRSSIPKEHTCFLKQRIQKKIRTEYVEAVEAKLKRHPFSMYPHYKDHMTPELFDKVVSILDPDMCVNSASSLPTPTEDDEEEEENCTETRNKHVKTFTQKVKQDVHNQKSRKMIKVNRPSKQIDVKTANELYRKSLVSLDEDIQ